MRVVIKLFASLQMGRFKTEELIILDGSTVLDALNLLDLQYHKVSIIRVNGKAASSDHVLQNSDQLALFPPMAGG